MTAMGSCLGYYRQDRHWTFKGKYAFHFLLVYDMLKTFYHDNSGCSLTAESFGHFCIWFTLINKLAPGLELYWQILTSTVQKA